MVQNVQNGTPSKTDCIETELKETEVLTDTTVSGYAEVSSPSSNASNLKDWNNDNRVENVLLNSIFLKAYEDYYGKKHNKVKKTVLWNEYIVDAISLREDSEEELENLRDMFLLWLIESAEDENKTHIHWASTYVNWRPLYDSVDDNRGYYNKELNKVKFEAMFV